MKYLTLILVFNLFLQTSFAQDKFVIETKIIQFFEALNEKDNETLGTFFSEDATLLSVLIKEGKEVVKPESVNDFLHSIEQISSEINIREEISELHIQINDHMAFASMEYMFFVNEKATHRGVNYFQFIKLNQTWKICNIFDSRIYE